MSETESVCWVWWSDLGPGDPHPKPRARQHDPLPGVVRLEIFEGATSEDSKIDDRPGRICKRCGVVYTESDG